MHNRADWRCPSAFGWFTVVLQLGGVAPRVAQKSEPGPGTTAAQAPAPAARARVRRPARRGRAQPRRRAARGAAARLRTTSARRQLDVSSSPSIADTCASHVGTIMNTLSLRVAHETCLGSPCRGVVRCVRAGRYGTNNRCLCTGQVWPWLHPKYHQSYGTLHCAAGGNPCGRRL